MSIPVRPVKLMRKVYTKILPEVHEQLSYWQQRADQIPNEELRNQALLSIKYKTFHCEGGAILALLAGENYEAAVKFIVAYQTISDYLDNLCDRSTSLDPKDFAALHEAMTTALTIDAPHKNYYRFRADQTDDHYLEQLVETCQTVLKEISNYEIIKPHLDELCNYYCDLQIHKHVIEEERVPRLKKWFSNNEAVIPTMSWYEFSACSGSTLGIFCLIAYALDDNINEEIAQSIRDGYFPYIQGLHILLDYFIDQQEDIDGGDLNFCFYYQDDEHLLKRFKHFIKEADRQTKKLPNRRFHQLINRGLLGIYLSDDKVRKQKDVAKLAKRMMRAGGPISMFFYLNGRAYRYFQRLKPALTF